MSFHIKLVASLIAIASAFAGGFVLATRLDASKAARIEARADAAYRAQVKVLVDQANALSAASEARESDLQKTLAAEKAASESLRHDIETRPTITRVVEKPVGGECPAVPSVDWRVFQRAFNCAAAGYSSCAPEPGIGALFSSPSARGR